MSAECYCIALAVKTIDAEIGNAGVIFAASVEILEAKLVLDRQNQCASIPYKGTGVIQDGKDGIIPADEQLGVFEYPDEGDVIEFLIGYEIGKVIAVNTDIGQVATPFGGYLCPSPATFHRDDGCTGLA